VSTFEGLLDVWKSPSYEVHAALTPACMFRCCEGQSLRSYQLLSALMTQKDVIPMCRKLGIGIVAYSPLGRGFLTGQIKSRDDLAGASFASTLGRLHVHWGLRA
jgi:aryl-alcohol dehydrogenase-like predicted oxidoreductase